MTTPTRQNEFISEARRAARNVWEGVLQLKALQAEWNAENYGSTLATPTAGFNEGITKTIVGAGVFAGADGVEAVLDGGLAANFADLL